ncbi:hypothetical protein BP00DRAFT_426443 [Aspergillus indologenus CBS 114.80]|uniref:Uncharacterized protein n=1 Tax=Aspergillus indologenus CBS 114.80 TaxID=1450541 RepID=A0A2V5I647_9EURO|nr:hypothetical protein BP00DRAFT_426443 [Aspergillus indologenus CBS 114.80]
MALSPVAVSKLQSLGAWFKQPEVKKELEFLEKCVAEDRFQRWIPALEDLGLYKTVN